MLFIHSRFFVGNAPLQQNFDKFVTAGICFWGEYKRTQREEGNQLFY